MNWMKEMWQRQSRKAQDVKALRIEHNDLTQSVVAWSSAGGDELLKTLTARHDDLMARLDEATNRICWCWPWESLTPTDKQP